LSQEYARTFLYSFFLFIQTNVSSDTLPYRSIFGNVQTIPLLYNKARKSGNNQRKGKDVIVSSAIAHFGKP